MNDSFWIKRNQQKKQYPSIQNDIAANIVIIGAGLTGLSTAYYVSNSESDVIVLESDKVGYGASGRNTGKITFQHGPVYHKLIEKYDKIFASKYYHAQLDAMRSMEAIIKEHHISCDFEKRDALLYTADPTKIFELQDEYQAYHDIGIEAEFIENTQMPFEIKGGILVHDQYAYDPYAYCLGLSQVLDERSVSIFEQSGVTDMETLEEGYDLLVNGYRVHANKVIFACQFPFIDHMHLYFSKMVPSQESVVYANVTESMSDTMMINIEEPTHSANRMHDTLIMTGNKHKSGQGTNEAYNAFIKRLHKLYPIHEIQGEWSSEDYMSFDDLPLVGRLDKSNDDLFFASGFNGWGNTISNMSAKILAAYVMNQYSTYAMLVSPQRSSFLSLPFLKENMNTAINYFKNRMKKGDIEYPMRKHAKQMEIDGHQYGVYRDEHDELYIVDITCPHMGCICNFNHVDKTWDCPCHGSRFSYKGDIVKGPASHHLHAYGDDFNTVDPHVKHK